ncbi:MAG: hypothetical protein CSB24_00295 [Deltaproteobacteria bacterium]|nr:MAG: hypothetical protein CSB24_00295 [Deltaproteobacteria bacterium]
MMAMLVLAGSASAATKLDRIGRSPFHAPPLTTAESLVKMVNQKSEDVKKGFEKAGSPELYEPFMAQIQSAEIQLVDYSKGAWFEWMLFKKKGKGPVRAAKDVTWVGENTFPAFRFDIEQDGMIYTFAVPLGCGNIALVGSKQMAPKEEVNQAPQCAMQVTPKKAFCGQDVTVDASGSSDADGNITRMDIKFIGGEGEAISEQTVDGQLEAVVAMPCGAKSLRVVLTDDKGAESSDGECVTAVESRKRVRFLSDLGYFHQVDPANHLFGRIGMEYRFTDNFSLLGLVGVAPHIHGIDGKTAGLVDLLGEYSFGSRYFVNFGVGGWITDGDSDNDAEDSQVDLIAGMGARIFGEPDDFNGSLFLEVRSAPDEMGDIDEYGRFGVGLRLRF